MNNQPPKWALNFFRWYCHRDFVEDIEGDLHERFDRSLEQRSISSAKLGFIKDVVKLCRPGIIKPLFPSQTFNQFGMLKNYFTIAFRSLVKQKLYSAINIGGLTLGLSCFILMFVYVQHELSYDNFYKNKDNIYRVYQQQVGNTYLGSDNFAVTPAGLAPELVKNYPEVENATTVVERSVLISGNGSSYVESGFWANTEFFNVFQYDFLQGNPKVSFNKPNAIVLTQSLASKIFNDNSAVGKILIISSHHGDQEFEITGIIKDLPKNSSFQFSYVANLQSNEEYVEATKAAEWNNNSYHTFLILNPDTDPLNLEAKFPELLSQHSSADRDYPFNDIYHVQPLEELHLQTSINFDVGLKGNLQYVLLFSLIGAIVLLLACINYMNLAIARSIQRAKEVGLRKVIGAVRWQLIGQFLGESVFITFIALILALGVSYWLIPIFGFIIERPLTLDLISNSLLMPMLAIIVLFVGLFSGSYPALFLSSLKPINTLKGKITDNSPKMGLQKWLIIIQYATSIVLIISSLIIFLQFDFMQNKELGYDKDHIVVVKTRSSDIGKSIDVIKNELLSHTNILSVTTSNNLPSEIGSSSLARLKEDGNDQDNLALYRMTADYDYLNTFGLELAAGRNYSRDIESDEEKVIINESAAKAFGWTPEEAIGNQFFKVGQSYVTVIGVVKDFHMFSMHLAIEPLMISLRKDYFNYTSVKINPNNIPYTLTLLEETISKHSTYPFDFQFMDNEFDRLYKSDIRLGKIFGLFTAVSIFIASIGLFGLAAYTTQRRTKEIGIRKVLGASVRLIVGLLAKDFLKMVLTGFVLAIPVAWFIMNLWLQDYAYRIEIEWWMFAIAGVIAGVIALFTIGSQTIKVAVSNPVDSLRSE